ncbi:MAG: hypothetical protein HY858_05130 [Candidatus Solibacter usitatus]|nr:hypothetical protein [Candidatus Solibacter usitatus]
MDHVGQTFETVRGRSSDLRRQGKSKDGAAQLLKLDHLGWQPNQFWNTRSLPGLHDELAR